ncbi:MAG: M15 family metallopeptidase [Coleofasciculaceae cyanobacterium]
MKRWTKFITLMALMLFFIGCQKITGHSPANSSTPFTQTTQSTSSLIARNVASPLPPDARLVDIRKVNNKIAIDMRYATTNNFLKQKLYPVSRCVLRGAAARRLSQVQDDLSRNGLGLKVYDCYRPLSIQKKLWEVMPDSRFVANPTRGSRHNRGAAVDLTLIDRNGRELEMPTGFDNFTERAYTNYSGGSTQSRNNRQILQNAMKKYGFIPLSTEWWHFDAPGWDKFSVLDVSFGEIP